jgi:hypothetical protein
MAITFEVKENNLWIESEVWNNLINSDDVSGMRTVTATAIAHIKRDGSFFINGERGVANNFHRLHEFENYLTQINEERKKSGLEAFLPENLEDSSTT